MKKYLTTFDEHLREQYGEAGSPERIHFETKAKAFAIGEIIRDARKEAKLTQQQLAERTGTKKSFISGIENGNSDIQLSTLFRLLEVGLGKRVHLMIES